MQNSKILTKLSVAATLITASIVTVSAIVADPDVGCFNNSGNLQYGGTNIYQTQGACQKQCLASQNAVWATAQGNTCYCGDEFPTTGLVDYVSNCNTKCLAWSQQCGGPRAWTFGLTGLVDASSVPNYNIGLVEDLTPSSTTLPSSAGTTNTASHVSSAVAQLVTVTSGRTISVTANSVPTSSSYASIANQQSSTSKTNSAGIAAGVVVGVVLSIALALGLWLLYRRRRRLEAEEEYQNAVSNKEFVNSITASKPVSDHRLDPVMLQQRRLSDGSIADNQDFSRRILKITNPDEGN